MNINQLNYSQLASFCRNSKVTCTWYGSRKFTSQIFIDGKMQVITAAAKEVYACIKNQSNFDLQTENTFRKVEWATRDRKVFSAQLNCFQKLVYIFIKAFSGLNFEDTWQGKFYGDQLCYFSTCIEKLRSRFHSFFNGAHFSHVIVYLCNRNFSASIDAIESPYGGFQKGSQFKEEGSDRQLLNDPSVLLIYIGITTPEVQKYNEDRCQVYCMKESEMDMLYYLGYAPKFANYMSDLSKKMKEKEIYP